MRHHRYWIESLGNTHFKLSGNYTALKFVSICTFPHFCLGSHDFSLANLPCFIRVCISWDRSLLVCSRSIYDSIPRFSDYTVLIFSKVNIQDYVCILGVVSMRRQIYSKTVFILSWILLRTFFKYTTRKCVPKQGTQFLP